MPVFVHLTQPQMVSIQDLGQLYGVWAPSADACWVVGQMYIRKWVTGGVWTAYESNWPDPFGLFPYHVYAQADDGPIVTNRWTGNRVYYGDGVTYDTVLSSTNPDPMYMFAPVPGTLEVYIGWYFDRVIGLWHATNASGSWFFTPITNSFYPDNIIFRGMWGTSLSDLRLSLTVSSVSDPTNRGLIMALSSGTTSSPEWSGYLGSIGGDMWKNYALVKNPPYDSAPGNYYRVLHKSGSVWSEMSAQPVSSGDLATYVCVGGVSDTDVWVGGTVGATYYRSPSKMWHWDGSAWTEYPISSGGEINKIHARTSTDVWAVGSKQAGNFLPMVIHWDGSAWTDRSFIP